MTQEDRTLPAPDQVSAELSALYEIALMSSLETEEDLLDQALEKATRLFPLRRFVVWEDGPHGGRVLVAWGVRQGDTVAHWATEDAPTRFRFVFGSEGTRTILMMEQAEPVTSKQRRLYTLYAQRLAAALTGVRNRARRREAEKSQNLLTEGLRHVVEIADELITCPDVDRVYRRAVELAREKLGLERCSILLAEGGRVRGTYGTDMQGRTTDERTHILPMDKDWAERFRPLGPGDPHWHISDARHVYWDGAKLLPVGHGWVAATPIIRAGLQPVAMFFNDTAVSGAPCNPVRQDVVAVFCSFLGDIIERKRAEDRLRDAEARYRTLVEQLPAITYIVELDLPSRTAYISPQVESLLGYTPREWIADPLLWTRCLHPEDSARVQADLRAKDQTGDPFELEYRVVARDGRTLWFRNQAVYMRDAAGQPRFVHGVMLDITRRKQAEEELERHRAQLEDLVQERTAELNASNEQLRREMAERERTAEALRESETKYRTLFEASTDAVFLETATGRILDCNPTACAMLGYTKQELLGMTVADLVPGDFAARLPGLAHEQMARGGVFIEALNRRKGGDVFPVEVSTRVVTLGEAQVVVAFVRDITERKRAEEERRVMIERVAEAKENELIERTNRLTSLGVLAAGVAHEVNNPLQGMLSHVNAVKRALPEDFPKLQSVVMVEKGIETITGLVRKLLALSREPTAKAETAVSGEAVEFVIQLLDHQFKDAGITITRREQDPSVRLAMPQRDLVQVLLNIFINARDAMPAGGRVTVTSRLQADECTIVLADTGPGIPKKILGQIFSPFFTTKGTKGTGLGLSVAESLIRHAGGRIEVESRPGKGSRFYLHIPVARETKT
ncbi:MAG: PAS domain S-box protein [Kiritimatiellae bacterium]|nr:PAS domain S-box protein [Kiritimatiellia bacterium]